MDDAAEEVKLTPAQLAEIEENKAPFLDKFKALVDEATDRQRHGTSLNVTFVNALKALYDEAEAAGAPGSRRQGIPDQPALIGAQNAPPPQRPLSPADLQLRADRAAKRAADQNRVDDAKAVEKQAEDDLAKDGTDE